jgi:transposase-like protein
MQKRYSEEFKESVIKKMMPPNPVSVSQLCKDTGVSDVTLYKWRKDYRNRGISVPSDQSKPDSWAAEDKLAVVIETASLNEVQLSEYCRSKGLYPEQVEQWKVSALSGYQQSAQVKKEKLRNRQEDKKKIKRLEKQLQRKDKALAETAALLVLSKKCEAIWGVNEED